MSQNAMDCLELIVQSMWKLFTGWKLPGLNFTPAQFFAFLIIFPLVINFVYAIMSGLVLNVQDESQSCKSRRGH